MSTVTAAVTAFDAVSAAFAAARADLVVPAAAAPTLPIGNWAKLCLAYPSSDTVEQAVLPSSPLFTVGQAALPSSPLVTVEQAALPSSPPVTGEQAVLPSPSLLPAGTKLPLLTKKCKFGVSGTCTIPPHKRFHVGDQQLHYVASKGRDEHLVWCDKQGVPVSNSEVGQQAVAPIDEDSVVTKPVVVDVPAGPVSEAPTPATLEVCNNWRRGKCTNKVCKFASSHDPLTHGIEKTSVGAKRESAGTPPKDSKPVIQNPRVEKQSGRGKQTSGEVVAVKADQAPTKTPGKPREKKGQRAPETHGKLTADVVKLLAECAANKLPYSTVKALFDVYYPPQ